MNRSFFRRGPGGAALVFLLLAGGAGCKVHTLTVPRIIPARTPLPTGQRLAIVPQTEGDAREERMAALVSKHVLDSRAFSLVDRSTLDRVLKEHKLQLSGLVNATDKAGLGNLLGADALVSLQVHECKVAEVHGNMEGRGDYLMGYAGSLSASIKYVDLATGQVLVQETAPENGRDSGAFGPRGTAATLEEGMFTSAGQRLAHAICPITIGTPIPLKSATVGDGGLTAQGIKLAEKNLLDEAMERWAESLAKFPKNAGAAYDLGLAHEKKGDLEKSAMYYRQALALLPDDDLVLEAVARVRPPSAPPPPR